VCACYACFSTEEREKFTKLVQQAEKKSQKNLKKIKNSFQKNLHFLPILFPSSTATSDTQYNMTTTEEKEQIIPTKTAGTILFCGCTDYKQVGRTKQIDESVHANVNVPSKISTFENLDDDDGKLEFTFIASGAAAAHNVAIDVKGRLWAWGRNENGQLGTGDKDNRNAPVLVKGIRFGENGDGEGEGSVKIVWAACGRSHTIAIDSEGNFYGCGSNKAGQLGVPITWSRQKKNVDDERVEFVKSASATHVTFVKATCGVDFTVLTDADGKMWSFGCPQYGQLGHGDDHEYNMKEGTVKLAYEPQPTPKMIRSGDLNPDNDYKVVKVSCGHNHVACFCEDGKIYTWGNGGYGRLGHRVQKDEFSPKMVEIQGGDRNLIPKDAILACGSTSTHVSACMGQLYAFGKLKVSGDNTMFPMPQMDLQGWVLRDFASGAVTFATCQNESTVTWGAGAYGELGYGPNGKKSSACPDLVPSLEGKRTIMVACGLGQTLFLVKSEDVKEGVPVFEPLPDTKGGEKKKQGAHLIKPGGAKKAKK
jgi:alpha-tubulin suppressor-like RCC1 family protein